MRVKVEFSSLEDVQVFTSIAQKVKEDVRLIGKDENGSDWSLSAKSFFCSLLLQQNFKRIENIQPMRLIGTQYTANVIGIFTALSKNL